VSVGLNFVLDTRGINKTFAKLQKEKIVAYVFNNARDGDGQFYWKAVNDGRKAITPIHAKALHWVNEAGEDVFAMYAGPVAPAHIREKSMPEIRELSKAIGFVTKNYQKGARLSSGKFNRGYVVHFVNRVVEAAVVVFQANTPVRTGNLKDSYKIKKAR
jgi:hypothetical protein